MPKRIDPELKAPGGAAGNRASAGVLVVDRGVARGGPPAGSRDQSVRRGVIHARSIPVSAPGVTSGGTRRSSG